ncbi:hypothetical protein SCL_1416 [Sulfuricaulis limicola]|uniref:Uncharacterized protein n=1 Tax=Sulfuricaulis limicola TaxID=1620215 RepID=A0A1B4XG12_9GAMM|nr:DUF6600 domain-containing protein [Sulfuricaulis limicola]BAV33727.1 hypothetical protein SCL_1416 [Sulfuricaulis limicola]
MRKPVLAFLLAVLVSGGFAGAAPTVAADVSVDISVFYNALAPYGQWVNRLSFGWVWVPHDVPVSWRPYTHGHWVYTDDYGWYWVSYWPWGWAPFHYGRWAYDDDYGWVWVPDTVWGPAWVDWRYGDGWIGWAPLPPMAVWRPGVGFSVRIVEIERYVHPTSWVFCHERNFRREHVYRHIELAARNVTIIQRTSNITRYVVEQDRIVNRGHDVDRLEKDTGQRFTRYRVREVASAAEQRSTPRGNEFSVYRPKVSPALPGARPPSSPPPRAAEPPERIRQQQETQRQQLLRQQQTERQQLQEHYRRQQQSEIRVLDEQHGREQKLLERRQQREYRMAPQSRKDEKSGERRRDTR